jgi:hypothetical protein
VQVLSVGRVAVGNVTQNEPFVAAKVAAAPLEYLEYLADASAKISHITELFDKCERLRVELGEKALKGTRFADLSDLPDDPDMSAKSSSEEDGGAPSSPQAAPRGEPAEAGDKPLTPDQLRAMVQRRVAEAANDGLSGGQTPGDPLGALLDLSALNPGAQGAQGQGLEAGADSDGEADSGGEREQMPRAQPGEDGPLEQVIVRVFREVAADGRRTKPGMQGGIGPTAPFLLPSGIPGCRGQG